MGRPGTGREAITKPSIIPVARPIADRAPAWRGVLDGGRSRERPRSGRRARSAGSNRRPEPAWCVSHDATADSTPIRSDPTRPRQPRGDADGASRRSSARHAGSDRSNLRRSSSAPGTTARGTRHQRESVRLVGGRFPEGRKMLGAGRSGSRPNRAGDRGRLTRRRSSCCGPHRSGASTAAITAAITRGPAEADWETLGPIEQRLGNWVRFSDSHTLPILPRFARWHIGS